MQREAADFERRDAGVGRGERPAVIGGLIDATELRSRVHGGRRRVIGELMVPEPLRGQGLAGGGAFSPIRAAKQVFRVRPDEKPQRVGGVGQEIEHVPGTPGGDALPDVAGGPAVRPRVLRAAVQGAAGSHVDVVELRVHEPVLDRRWRWAQQA